MTYQTFLDIAKVHLFCYFFILSGYIHGATIAFVKIPFFLLTWQLNSSTRHAGLDPASCAGMTVLRYLISGVISRKYGIPWSRGTYLDIFMTTPIKPKNRHVPKAVALGYWLKVSYKFKEYWR